MANSIGSIKDIPKEMTRKECSYCHQSDSIKFKICTQCKKALYCSQDCQRKSWKEHREICKATVIKTATSPSTNPPRKEIGPAIPQGVTPSWYLQAKESFNSSRELVEEPPFSDQEFAALVEWARNGAAQMRSHINRLKKEGKTDECNAFKQDFKKYTQESYDVELKNVAAVKPGAEHAYKVIVDRGIASISKEG